MANQSLKIAPIYLREGEHLLSKLIKFLHVQEKVSGVAVLKGVMGFGPGGKIRTRHLQT